MNELFLIIKRYFFYYLANYITSQVSGEPGAGNEESRGPKELWETLTLDSSSNPSHLCVLPGLQPLT